MFVNNFSSQETQFHLVRKEASLDPPCLPHHTHVHTEGHTSQELRIEPGEWYSVCVYKAMCLGMLEMTSCIDTCTSEHGCVFRAGGTGCQELGGAPIPVCGCAGPQQGLSLPPTARAVIIGENVSCLLL